MARNPIKKAWSRSAYRYRGLPHPVT